MSISHRNANISCFRYIKIVSPDIKRKQVLKVVEDLQLMISYKECIALAKRCKSFEDWKEQCEEAAANNFKDK